MVPPPQKSKWKAPWSGDRNPWRSFERNLEPLPDPRSPRASTIARSQKGARRNPRSSRARRKSSTRRDIQKERKHRIFLTEPNWAENKRSRSGHRHVDGDSPRQQWSPPRPESSRRPQPTLVFMTSHEETLKVPPQTKSQCSWEMQLRTAFHGNRLWASSSRALHAASSVLGDAPTSKDDSPRTVGGLRPSAHASPPSAPRRAISGDDGRARLPGSMLPSGRERERKQSQHNVQKRAHNTIHPHM